MTTCPSGVNYMHLVDHGRRWIEQRYQRPWAERALRRLLGNVLTRPARFRLALRGAVLARRFARFLPRQLTPLLALAPASVPKASPTDRQRVFPAEGERRMRAALLTGCAQRVLAPEINEATIRLLTRHGCEVVVPRGSGCCGSLVHHLGQEAEALAFARADIDAWERERIAGGLDAIVINASGCGTTVKDYGFMLREDPAYADKAARIAALARDVTEIIETLGSAPTLARGRGHQPARRLSFRLLDAARPANSRRAKGAADDSRVRSAGSARGPPLLRLGRDLQFACSRRSRESCASAS